MSKWFCWERDHKSWSPVIYAHKPEKTPEGRHVERSPLIPVPTGFELIDMQIRHPMPPIPQE
ncbi:hypothetical protein [Mesorhizobium sp. CN2-181]|uniref:hypothetical protein n=1 Tax=Mesorhizobium yinganensis TaxID=3157707 RepID=UPI0032B85AB9